MLFALALASIISGWACYFFISETKRLRGTIKLCLDAHPKFWKWYNKDGTIEWRDFSEEEWLRSVGFSEKEADGYYNAFQTSCYIPRTPKWHLGLFWLGWLVAWITINSWFIALFSIFAIPLYFRRAYKKLEAIEDGVYRMHRNKFFHEYLVECARREEEKRGENGAV